MLLEVVIAVGVLVLGMAFVGLQIHNASRVEMEAERSLRGLLLAERMMAELDTGLIEYDEEVEEEFGRLFPDYGWRMKVEQTSVPDLNLVKLEILYQPRPQVDEEFNFDSARVVHTLYTMRATPTRLDLTRDFGMDDKKADELTERFANLGDRAPNVRDIDHAWFRDASLEDLLEVAPALLDAFGISLSDLKKVLPPDLLQSLEQAQAEFEGSRTGEEGGTGGESGDKAGGASAPDKAPTAGGTPAPSPGKTEGEAGSGGEGEMGGDQGGKPGHGVAPAPSGPNKPPGQPTPTRGGGRRPLKGNRGNQGPRNTSPS
jgi:hypothetical protein